MVKVGAMSQEFGHRRPPYMSVEDAIKRLAKIGLDGVELECGTKRFSQLTDKATQKKIKETADSAGIKISNLAPHQDFLYPNIWGVQRELYALKGAMEMAVNMNIDLVRIHICSNISYGEFPQLLQWGRSAGPKYARFWSLSNQYSQGVVCVKEATKMAEDLGVTLILDNHFFLTVLDHLKIVQEIGSSNLKLTIDTRNAVENGEDLCATIRACGKLLVHSHVKDGRYMGANGVRAAGEVMAGVPIGDGNSTDWEATLKAFKDINFKGFLSIEGAHVLPMYDPWDVVQRGAKYLRDLAARI